MGWFVGQVMREMKGSADAKLRRRRADGIAEINMGNVYIRTYILFWRENDTYKDVGGQWTDKNLNALSIPNGVCIE
jgi:hypothetical protein